MKIDQIRLTFVELPLVGPFRTSYGSDSTKTAWIVSVESGDIWGLSESVEDKWPLYNEETHHSVYGALKNDIVPRLWGIEISHPSKVSELLTPIRGNRMAKATVEMAVWDWFARQQEIPLWRLLGGDRSRRTIPVGVSIGIQDTPDELVHLAERYLRQGYRRIKVKIQPGLDYGPLAELRKRLGGEVLLMADANSAYTLNDLNVLQALDELNLMMIEQPLADDDLLDHATLARKIATPICLDESIRTPAHARQAIRIGACAVINMKVGRVGGYSRAREIHDIAQSSGIPLWCGGMLETGIGRAHNLHLSTLPGFTLPGDTSASDRYFHEEIVAMPLFLNEDGTISVPEGPGIGVEPDCRKIQRYTRYQEVLTSSGVTRQGSPYRDPWRP